MRRHRAVVGLVVVAVTVVFAIAFWIRGPHPCRTTFEQVREGMTLDEVSATVGRPPGIYTTRTQVYAVGGPNDCRQHWAADDAEMIVHFGPDGRAFQVQVLDPPPDYRGPVRRCLDLLPF
jgi:hypothetical protein